jgi:hypothetical protein
MFQHKNINFACNNLLMGKVGTFSYYIYIYIYIYIIHLREEHRLRVFENRVLRRIFGPKRDEVTGKYRKLHNKELHDLYSSLSIIRIMKSRRMRWAGHVARMGEKRNTYRLMV